MKTFLQGAWWFMRYFLTIMMIIAFVSLLILFIGGAEAKGLFDLFEDKPKYDFISKDTVFVEYPENEGQFVEACKINSEGNIQDCWIINWKDAKECLEDKVERRKKPVPIITPNYEDLMKPKD